MAIRRVNMRIKVEDVLCPYCNKDIKDSVKTQYDDAAIDNNNIETGFFVTCPECEEMIAYDAIATVILLQ
jgi:uncharacterized protein with PIN domain